ncbi:type II restriction enzyme [Lentilactobacillus kribbianus]|uniref:type II restriction enzyme n=1 Tax=Lentilactobacillus kribbianus TaxID=2729622 RepID=UPI0015523CE5|nr:hypothetical protein [Lentilactobacillus kribbianus]
MIKKRHNKNEVWSAIFDKLGSEILSSINSEQGYFDISADQIRYFSNELHGPDVRLLAKFDRSSALPDVFKNSSNDIDDFINILPIGNINGQYMYRLGKFNAYAPLTIKEDDTPEIIRFPDIQTIRQDHMDEKGVSENTYLDLAFTSNMLNRAFDTENSPLMPVMHGRLRSGDMNFFIGKNNKIFIHTGSSQVEIDATYENDDSIVIIEAKSVPEKDFLVRQLYYPYYIVRSRGVTKSIRPSFMLMQEGNYYFNEYEFGESDNYSTIKLVKQKVFRFADANIITLDKVVNMVKNTPIVPEPQVLFPQTNSRIAFVKTLGLLEESKLEESEIGLTSKQIASGLGYSIRQGDYYGYLPVYLGLARKNNQKFYINARGSQLYLKFNSNEGRIELIRLLLSHKPFRLVFNWFMTDNHIKMAYEKNISKEQKEKIVNLIRNNVDLYGISSESSTFSRRVSSIISLVKSCVFDVIEK